MIFMARQKEKLSVPRDMYLSAGVHIGMTTKTADMKRFIYKIRPSGLAVLNVGMLDKRLGIISNMLAKANNILIVARKETNNEAIEKFSEAVGAKAVLGRFMPGTLTNPSSTEFFEPDVMIVTDPLEDKQAITEALKMRMPIVGLADTFNETSHIDFILPCNNKGKKSLGLVLWILAKMIKEKRNETFNVPAEDFGYEKEVMRTQKEDEDMQEEQKA